MEIQSEHDIEIFHTLDKIRRVNQAIRFHSSLENPDSFTIEQYRKLKQELSEQLVALLSYFDLQLKAA